MNGNGEKGPAHIFKALSEDMRLRMLRILEGTEFSVVEVMEILDAPQSTISRHLARLKEAGLVESRRQGAMIFYSRSRAESPFLQTILEASWDRLPQLTKDREAVERVLERRRKMSQAYFDTVARRYSDIVEPGGSWQALAGALACGFEGRTVADIGAGQGELTLLLAQSAETVYAVDHSREMVACLRERAAQRPNIVVEWGDFEALPLPSDCCHVVIASQILHHCPRPRKALAEAGRIARPGGRLVVIDLAAHNLEWTREKLADHWLGFDRRELERWLEAAGFQQTRSTLYPTGHNDLMALLVTGRKPDRGAAGPDMAPAEVSDKPPSP